LIHRKIFRVKTVGSRETKDLRPDIELPRGINSLVLSYNDGTCIIEVWGSDHPILSVEDRFTIEKLRKVEEQAVEVLDAHPLSPRIIGAITMLESVIKQMGSAVDEERKEITVKGKIYKFVRKEYDDRQGENRYILDEG